MAMYQQIIFPSGQTESDQTFRSALLLHLGGIEAPVKLVLSSEVDPPSEVSRAKIPAGTTLAVQMTPAAALMVLRQIREMAVTLGWPLPPEALGQV